MSAGSGFKWEDEGCTDKMAAPICQMMPATSTVPSTTTTTAMVESTTSYGPYHVELRGGYVGEDEAWGNVYAVNSNGYFGPVCDDGWGPIEVAIVCWQLGYGFGSFQCGSAFGLVNEAYAMDDVNCNWDNRKLQDCDYNLNNNCSPYEGAGVWCYNDFYTTTPAASCGCDCTYDTTTPWAPEQQDEENVDW